VNIILGTNKRLIVGGKFDSDGEILISMPIHGQDVSCTDTWINEEDAKLLIKHLKTMFEIK